MNPTKPDPARCFSPLKARLLREEWDYKRLVKDATCASCGASCPAQIPIPKEVLCVECTMRLRYCENCENQLGENSSGDFCSDECAQETQQKIISSRLKKWIQSECPLEYQMTVREKLPAKEQFDLVSSWKFGPKGMVLFGESGRGKSRSAYYLLKRLVGEGYSVKAIPGITFVEEVVNRTKPGGSDDLQHWIRPLKQCQVLFIDDLDKGRLSDRVQTELFSLVEYRTSNRLPIMITTNLTGKVLAAHLSEKHGGAIVRRLREFCEGINFDESGGAEP